MSNNAYRFTITSGQVTEVFELGHGVSELKSIDANETYKIIDATTIEKTETKTTYLEIERYEDVDGDGTFFRTLKSYQALTTSGGTTTDGTSTVGGDDDGEDDDHEDHDSDDDADGHDDDIDDDGSDDDHHQGSADDDLVYGSLGKDTIHGDDGDDDLDGGEDDDDLHGDLGADDLYGGEGDDNLDGGDGDDHLHGGHGDDKYQGGAGFDVADLSSSAAAVKVSLASKKAQNTGDGNDSFDSIEGLTGTDFDDNLSGSKSGNSIFGGDGDDSIQGKGGGDSLVGGLGADTFVIDYKSKTGEFASLDDFTSGEDTLELFAKYFKGVSNNNLADRFVIATEATDADDRLIFDQASGSLYYDRDGSGSKAAVKIVVIGTGAISVDDILIH